MIALQLCRPLSGAVSRPGGAIRLHRTGSFNCAAPFRERLGDLAAIHAAAADYASIVPPPFGSG